LPAVAFRQMQLVYNHATKRSCWHITIDDGIVPQPTPHTGIMAVDLGEIHPAACTNGEQATIIACRALRANGQHRNKKTADVQEMIARCQPGSRRGKKLVASRKRLQAQTDTRQRDLLHKVSRAVVQAAQAMQAGTIVLGDGRDVADNTKTEKRLSRENRQQISTWPHGQLRHYITYKAVAVGITTELINEAYTSTTCPKCGQRNQPKGRHYRCSACGFVGHRDNVGSTVRRFGADKIPFPERSGWEQQTARTTAYLAAKAKGDNSMLLKRGNPKIGRIVCPASPVRMVRLTCQTLVSSDATHRLS
jgi:IS605 OrfB family transposase